MYQVIVYAKYKSVVQATPVNPTVFVQIPLHIVLTNRVSQFRLNVCTRIKAGSTNDRK